MIDSSGENSAEDTEEPGQNFWYELLNMFPFFFLPLTALIGVLSSIVMPYLTNVHDRY